MRGQSCCHLTLEWLNLDHWAGDKVSWLTIFNHIFTRLCLVRHENDRRSVDWFTTLRGSSFWPLTPWSDFAPKATSSLSSADLLNTYLTLPSCVSCFFIDTKALLWWQTYWGNQQIICMHTLPLWLSRTFDLVFPWWCSWWVLWSCFVDIKMHRAH